MKSISPKKYKDSKEAKAIRWVIKIIQSSLAKAKRSRYLSLGGTI